MLSPTQSEFEAFPPTLQRKVRNTLSPWPFAIPPHADRCLPLGLSATQHNNFHAVEVLAMRRGIGPPPSSAMDLTLLWSSVCWSRRRDDRISRMQKA